MATTVLIHFTKPSSARIVTMCGIKFESGMNGFHARNYAPDSITCPKCRAKIAKNNADRTNWTIR